MPGTDHIKRRRRPATILDRAVAYWTARGYDGVLDALRDWSGNGLHARLGSAIGSDTNDPLRLQYSGAKYVYFPGSSGNKLTLARPVASVDYTITYADGTTASGNSTADPLVFGDTDVQFAGLKVRSIALTDHSGGATVGLFDANLAVEPYASYTDPQANVWTFNRTTSGRKLAVVDRDLFLLGTDDYFEVADHPLLRLGTKDSLTAVIAIRQHATPVSSGRYISKAGTGTITGWNLKANATNLQPNAQIGDGTNAPQAAPGMFTAGSLVLLALVRDSKAGKVFAYTVQGATVGTGSTADNTTGSPSTTDPLRIGAQSAGAASSFQDFCFFGAAVFREALNPVDLVRLKSEMIP